jgi:riboflavin kinase / FMN adenylyltransferase
MSNFSAKIISGHGRGRQLGYPTLNLQIKSGEEPVPGVYVALLEAQEAVLHVGPRPTFNASNSIEAHLLNTDDPQVSEPVKVEVLLLLRDTVKFDSVEALKKQIEQDIIAARKYFASYVTKT